ncbi:MAG: hypothetical protein HY867_08580 [Chloroflexi bacterium]|nr:hypothetical protein [Chloroflexota bacterium]
MAKRDDKHSLAKDYLARIKWDGEHPYMGDGSKPPIPNWKYKPVYKKAGKPRSMSRPISILISIIGLVVSVFLMLKISEDRPGVGVIAVIILYSIVAIFYFMLQNPKHPSDD